MFFSIYNYIQSLFMYICIFVSIYLYIYLSGEIEYIKISYALDCFDLQ